MLTFPSTRQRLYTCIIAASPVESALAMNMVPWRSSFSCDKYHPTYKARQRFVSMPILAACIPSPRYILLPTPRQSFLGHTWSQLPVPMVQCPSPFLTEQESDHQAHRRKTAPELVPILNSVSTICSTQLSSYCHQTRACMMVITLAWEFSAPARKLSLPV